MPYSNQGGPRRSSAHQRDYMLEAQDLVFIWSVLLEACLFNALPVTGIKHSVESAMEDSLQHFGHTEGQTDWSARGFSHFLERQDDGYFPEERLIFFYIYYLFIRHHINWSVFGIREKWIVWSYNIEKSVVKGHSTPSSRTAWALQWPWRPGWGQFGGICVLDRRGWVGEAFPHTERDDCLSFAVLQSVGSSSVVQYQLLGSGSWLALHTLGVAILWHIMVC